ncbi:MULTISPECIES: hypothetical protein [Clostridium]|uniref:hypothetical protein n=1 Tax=Clostridium TaxID=1485 RepID=UPI0013E95BF2|nr:MULTISPECIES: hypothetical protein [Clostridium]MBW9159019.1 hypothetical protein [Clostridium tagluense]MBZ9623723.1 hypothetical protein [Clostridium sp. FP2]MBZ9635115.1 hypothetical protein [Clostridium sp. FP1]WLC63633.1 hypothetical protein KTC93_12105 [Clostridium tagluense]
MQLNKYIALKEKIFYCNDNFSRNSVFRLVTNQKFSGYGTAYNKMLPFALAEESFEKGQTI